VVGVAEGVGVLICSRGCSHCTEASSTCAAWAERAWQEVLSAMGCDLGQGSVQWLTATGFNLTQCLGLSMQRMPTGLVRAYRY
jgi:hypothetical protein